MLALRSYCRPDQAAMRKAHQHGVVAEVHESCSLGRQVAHWVRAAAQRMKAGGALEVGIAADAGSDQELADLAAAGAWA